MSTQSTPSILFTHRSSQQGFRLLELPPDLAEVLDSENPPILELKSPSPSPNTNTTTSNSSGPGTDYVNLCTPTNTYSIRQVHSSNSLHILRPSNGVGVRRGDLRIVGGGGATNNSQKEGDDKDGDVCMDMDMDIEPNLNVEGTMTSISKCGSTLELHTPAEGFSAKPFLLKATRVYDKDLWEYEGQSQDEDAGAQAEEEIKRSLGALFADVPVSRAQCERDWIEICAFVRPGHRDGYGQAHAEHGPKQSYWRPSAEMKLEVWKRIIEGAVLQGINLGSQFLVSDLWKSVLDDEGLAPFPRGLFVAVVYRIREVGEGVERALADGEMKWASIGKETCIRWAGEVYLEAMADGPASAVAESEFINAWKDHLLEAWREDVSISILPEKCFMRPEPKTVCFATDGDQQKVKKNLPTDTSAATAAKKTRNWHELFKNQKRQKR
ncbi:putative sister chromatid cohesion protein Dcc1 [Aspergillus undulatus]|uniref:putative sister chromatid cohesion protein Dcc1 n=1 Tax=Aspergillus undulatus TaxID=1810928 RepID=UPI003CCD4AF9